MHVTFDSLKTFYNILVQKLKNHRGNWNQNDPTADDYIKNRPFYSEGMKETTIMDMVVNFDNSSSNMESSGPTVYQTMIEDSSVKSFKIGETYTVIWDGQTYKCIAQDISGIGALGNASLIGYMGSAGYEDTGEPFLIGAEQDYGYIVFSIEDGSHTMVIKTMIEIVKKLDKKFIDMPDDIVTGEELNDVIDNIDNIDNQLNNLSRVAFSGNYYDLNSYPTVYEDVVRYSYQNLTDAQKTRARTNIGAADKIISYGDFLDDWKYRTTLSSTNYHDQAREIYFKEVIRNDPYFNRLGSCDVAKVNFLNNIWYCKASTIKVSFVDQSTTAVCFGNKSLYSITEEDTGEPFLLVPDNQASQLNQKGIYFAKIEADEVITIYSNEANSFIQLDEILIPDTIARVSDIPEIPEVPAVLDENGKLLNSVLPYGYPYMDITEIVPEQSIEVIDIGQLNLIDLSYGVIEIGKSYTVKFNEVEYNCVAWSHTLYGGIPFVGNAMFFGIEGVGESVPFAIGCDPDSGFALYPPAAGIWTVSITMPTFHKISQDYLPDSKTLNLYACYRDMADDGTAAFTPALKPDDILSWGGAQYKDYVTITDLVDVEHVVIFEGQTDVGVSATVEYHRDNYGRDYATFTFYSEHEERIRIMSTREFEGDPTPVATEEYVTRQIANLVNSAPDALNTLDELAAALGDDENFATTVTNQIAAKQDAITGTAGQFVVIGTNGKPTTKTILIAEEATF